MIIDEKTRRAGVVGEADELLRAKRDGREVVQVKLGGRWIAIDVLVVILHAAEGLHIGGIWDPKCSRDVAIAPQLAIERRDGDGCGNGRVVLGIAGSSSDVVGFEG